MILSGCPSGNPLLPGRPDIRNGPSVASYATHDTTPDGLPAPILSCQENTHEEQKIYAKGAEEIPERGEFGDDTHIGEIGYLFRPRVMISCPVQPGLHCCLFIRNDTANSFKREFP